MAIYKYKVNMTYTHQGKQFLFDEKHIQSVSIEYDYINKNRPIIVATLSISRNIIDMMIDNKEKDRIIVNIESYDSESEMKVFKKYINDEYMYFMMNENKNSYKTIDTLSDIDEDDFETIKIGLMNFNLIDKNNLLVNTIVTDATIGNILIYYCSKVNPLLIEPLPNTIRLENFMIPPMEKLTDLVEYLNKQYPLYDTEYRLFFDNDITYLLSSSGKKIKTKYELYDTVIINIMDNVILDSQAQGMVTDSENECYIINIDPEGANYHNSSTKINTNNITTIDSEGNIQGSTIGGLTGNMIKRVTNNDSNNIINSSATIPTSINIYKEYIDSSEFTINKEYYINNEDTNFLANNGKYILNNKKDIFVREEGYYKITTILGMKKVAS